MRALAPLALATVLAGPLVAQASEFGTRGFGLPLRPISVRASATGGAFGFFDIESASNPSSFAFVGRSNVSFQTVQTWTSAENPVGTASTRDNRYPGFMVAAPLGGTRLAIAVSASGYTDRNFSLASMDTVILRDEPVETTDTLTSLGGISDLRAAMAWRMSSKVQWGLGLHLLTGSNRITNHRVFSDTTYSGASEHSTISYLSYGLSIGVTARPIPILTLAGMARADTRIRIERDTAQAGRVNLPMTLGAGARLQLGRRLLMAGSATFRNWERSDSGLVALGGLGSRNTTEWDVGFEFIPKPTHPGSHPIRLGMYRSGLPFPLQAGLVQRETGISAGTSLEFAGGRARSDITLSRVWRSGGPDFSERAVMLNAGISIRP